MATETPTCGRTVHFVMPSGKHRPALVNEVAEDGRCDLTVFTNGGKDGYINNQVAIASHDVEYDKDGKPGTWHWPERATTAAAEPTKSRKAPAAEVAPKETPG